MASKTMNPEAQVVFDTILAKSKDDLTEEDKAFLRARRSYLTKAQVEDYEDILEAEPEAPVKDESSNREEALAIIGERDLSELNSKELRKVAQRLGVPHTNTNKDELLVALDTVLGQGAADKPE